MALPSKKGVQPMDLEATGTEVRKMTMQSQLETIYMPGVVSLQLFAYVQIRIQLYAFVNIGRTHCAELW